MPRASASAPAASTTKCRWSPSTLKCTTRKSPRCPPAAIAARTTRATASRRNDGSPPITFSVTCSGTDAGNRTRGTCAHAPRASSAPPPAATRHARLGRRASSSDSCLDFPRRRRPRILILALIAIAARIVNPGTSLARDALSERLEVTTRHGAKAYRATCAVGGLIGLLHEVDPGELLGDTVLAFRPDTTVVPGELSAEACQTTAKARTHPTVPVTFVDHRPARAVAW
jgi:hypothetical protein